MSINLVQFQKGLSMVEFMQQYGTEAKAYLALYRARWPHGFRCPACDDRRRSRFRRGRQVYYQCNDCRHQTTLLSGTVFEATKLPLTTWFLASHLLTATKTNMAALELKRPLGVSYEAAWRLKHKVMQAMAGAPASPADLHPTCYRCRRPARQFPTQPPGSGGSLQADVS